jgi:hypothetical protein
MEPRPTPPLPAEAATAPRSHQMAPHSLLDPPPHIGQAPTRVLDPEVVRPPPEDSACGGSFGTAVLLLPFRSPSWPPRRRPPSTCSPSAIGDLPRPAPGSATRATPVLPPRLEAPHRLGHGAQCGPGITTPPRLASATQRRARAGPPCVVTGPSQLVQNAASHRADFGPMRGETVAQLDSEEPWTAM